MDLPAPIETLCEDQTLTFFHFRFSITPITPGNATCDWKKLAEESLASYVRNHCAEGVLVQAIHTDILRLEVAIRFSEKGRDVKLCPRKFEKKDFATKLVRVARRLEFGRSTQESRYLNKDKDAAV